MSMSMSRSRSSGLNVRKRSRSTYFRVSDSDDENKKIRSVSPAMNQSVEKSASPAMTRHSVEQESASDDDGRKEYQSDDGCATNYRAGYGGYSPSSLQYKPIADWDADEAPEPKPSQPLFPALWAGDFTFQNRFSSSTTASVYGLNACLSSNACPEARAVVEHFPSTIQWERLPRRSVWPKSFELRSRPTDNDIAVFFFPSLTKHEAAYDSLLFDLIRHDSALRMPVEGSYSRAEMLLFTSIELPHQSMRFQGKLFLWGVIRDR